MNPYIIIGLLVFFGGSNFWSFETGRKIENTAQHAANEKAVTDALTQAKTDAEIDYGVQQQLALDKQKHDLLAQQKHTKVQAAIAADPASVACKSAPATFSVLLDSIRASNAGAAPATGASDGAVSSSNGTPGPDSGSDPIRSRLNLVDAFHVPGQSPRPN